MAEYILGTSSHELDRLGLQQRVWGHVMVEFFEAVGVPEGAACLDAGCGPGFGVEMLLERAGSEGTVLALDESPRWIEHVEAVAQERGWKGVETRCAQLQDLELEPRYDVVFMRWVLSFLTDPADIVRRLAAGVKAGGTLAIIDYNHEGVSLFPRSPAFERVIAATRELYHRTGGNPWVAGQLPGLLRAAGLSPEEPRSWVLSGGPDSGPFAWADAFFTYHCDGFVEAGVLSSEERETFLQEWQERRSDPDAVFFSPIVVGAIGRKPA